MIIISVLGLLFIFLHQIILIHLIHVPKNVKKSYVPKKSFPYISYMYQKNVKKKLSTKKVILIRIIQTITQHTIPKRQNTTENQTIFFLKKSTKKKILLQPLKLHSRHACYTLLQHHQKPQLFSLTSKKSYSSINAPALKTSSFSKPTQIRKSHKVIIFVCFRTTQILI